MESEASHKMGISSEMQNVTDDFWMDKSKEGV